MYDSFHIIDYHCLLHLLIITTFLCFVICFMFPLLVLLLLLIIILRLPTPPNKIVHLFCNCCCLFVSLVLILHRVMHVAIVFPSIETMFVLLFLLILIDF